MFLDITRDQTGGLNNGAIIESLFEINGIQSQSLNPLFSELPRLPAINCSWVICD